MKTWILVPEGLATDVQGNFAVSDYYKAVLDLFVQLRKPGDRAFLAPANSFGAARPEDHFGFQYLKERQVTDGVEIIGDDIPRVGYLDTLDNALLVKRHLTETGRWPLGAVTLVCNRPHKLRSAIMFKLIGFSVDRVLTTRPAVASGKRMVRRLWFYDYPIVQYIYEFFAFLYGCFRFFMILIR
jgi:hypothetical protein